VAVVEMVALLRLTIIVLKSSQKVTIHQVFMHKVSVVVVVLVAFLFQELTPVQQQFHLDLVEVVE